MESPCECKIELLGPTNYGISFICNESEYLFTEGLVLKKKNRRAVRKTRRTEFDSFLEDALSRFEFETENLASIRQQMTELWDRHKGACAHAEVLTALQMCVQSVAESFVQVDRAAYLQEQGMASVEIVKVMDDALSPRCCALIARKTI